MAEDQAKQIIVWNNSLKGVPLGKKMAQAAHASIAFLTAKMQVLDFHNANPGERDLINISPVTLTDAERAWIEGSFRKIVCYVKTETELLELHEKALAASLVSHLICDSGYTVFDVPTNTCCAIGPDWASHLDPVTKDLPLL